MGRIATQLRSMRLHRSIQDDQSKRLGRLSANCIITNTTRKEQNPESIYRKEKLKTTRNITKNVTATYAYIGRHTVCMMVAILETIYFEMLQTNLYRVYDSARLAAHSPTVPT